MRRNWLVLACLLWAPLLFAQSAPVLFFSDLTWGPNTGWNGSSSQGAAVTVWGKNFGATRGTSYVTLNGAQLTSNANYAEWDATGPARALERITFWVPSSAAAGAGNITVTVNGVASNALPFEVAPATILFVDVTNGNNSNDGRTTSTAWKDLWKWTPCLSNDPYHYPSHCNTLGDAQYIMYVRGGTYTTKDPYSGAYTPFIGVGNPFGSPTARKAIVGYPGETPILNTSGTANSPVIQALEWSPYGYGVNYVTIAKLTTQGGWEFWPVFGEYSRIVGNTMADMTTQDWAGVISVFNSHHTSIYGNLFNHDGYDSYKHAIYIKTQPIAMGNTYDQSVLYTEVGFNEFTNYYASDAHGGVIFLSRSSDQAAQYIHDYTYVYANLFNGGNTDYLYSGDSTPLGPGHLYWYNNIHTANTSVNGGLTIYFGTGGGIQLYNNVFYQSNPNIWVTYDANPIFSNNIWWQQSGGNFLNTSLTTGIVHSDHDLWYNGTPPTNAPPVYITNATMGNPQFVNPAGNDFHLQSTSAARGVGANLSNAMSALPWGTYDYDGKLRPASGAWDAGPLQYATVSGSTRPNPPTGLTAVVR